MRMIMAAAIFMGCGGAAKVEVGAPGEHCIGDRPPPSIQAHSALPGSNAGGAGAWVEIATSHAEPTLNDNHVLLDGHELAIVRVTGGDEHDDVVDASRGQLTPRQNNPNTHASTAPAHVIAFRIPAGTAPGTHAITLRTCTATSEESVSFEVLPNAAPSIDSVRLVRGEWSSLLIKGNNLRGVDEAILVGADGAVTELGNVTQIDETSIRVPLDKLGTFDVFLKSPNGLGGGPPNGVLH